MYCKKKGGIIKEIERSKMNQKEKEIAMPSAMDIADFFIWKSTKEGGVVTNKKLQKLLYYAQAWYLAIQDKPLFNDKIEAWIHGPTVREVYFAYRDCGFNPIKKEVNDSIADKLKEQKTLLDNVWSVYGKFDGNYLEELTHNELPWQEAREGLELNMASENEISLETMKKFYRAKLV